MKRKCCLFDEILLLSNQSIDIFEERHVAQRMTHYACQILVVFGYLWILWGSKKQSGSLDENQTLDVLRKSVNEGIFEESHDLHSK